MQFSDKVTLEKYVEYILVKCCINEFKIIWLHTL